MRLSRALHLALVVCAAARAEDALPDASMTASIVEGAATVQRAGAATLQSLAQGAVLNEGDVVRTGSDARVEIAMASGSTLRLGPGATFEIRRAGTGGRSFSARIWLGSVWAKVHKLLEDESFEVETQNAVAGVRGTEFLVDANAQGGEDRVRVYEGAVEVRDHSGQWTRRVEKGRELTFHRSAHPDAPHAFDPSADHAHPVMRWVHEHPVHERAQRDEAEGARSRKEERGKKQIREKRRLLR